MSATDDVPANELAARRERLKALKAKKGWPDDGYEAKGFDYLQDSRIAALDMEANELLSEVDELGRTEAVASGDCAKLAKLKSTGEQLLAEFLARRRRVFARDLRLGRGLAKRRRRRRR